MPRWLGPKWLRASLQCHKVGGFASIFRGPKELEGPKGSQTTGALNSAGLGPRQLDTYGQPLGTCKLTFPNTGVVT